MKSAEVAYPELTVLGIATSAENYFSGYLY
jgi:hypothetical protein